MTFRLVVFTARPMPYVLAATVHRLSKRMPDLEILILEHARPRSTRSIARSQWRNIQRHGWRWVPYRAGLAARDIADRLRRRGRSGVEARLPATRALQSLLQSSAVRIAQVESLTSPDVVAQISAFKPDLGLSCGGPILKRETFAAPRLGTINLHQGKLPQYRGMPPAFWELWNAETEVHASVHMVDDGLDTGALIATDRVPVGRFATPESVRIRLDAVSPELIVKAIETVRAGTVQPIAQAGEGHTSRAPTLAQRRELVRRRAALTGERRTDLAGAAKRTALQLYANAKSRSPAGRDAVAVLLYHRVSDDYRDNVSCSVDAFDQHMRYLSDHHRVVSLQSLLDGPMPSGEGPVVAVTFDDGYLDNYEYAAPILVKHDIPATFFVSTRIVDEGLIFEHDRIALGHKVPTMSWAQMREMQSAGLSFGAHTANHVNMARVSDSEAEAELVSSRDLLRERLAIGSSIMFAYPYGKREDFTARRLEQVKAAGYACNCSAYGGVNPLAVDRWNIKRFGVDYRFAIPTLRSRIYGFGDTG